jgi:hypothetical protein
MLVDAALFEAGRFHELAHRAALEAALIEQDRSLFEDSPTGLFAFGQG